MGFFSDLKGDLNWQAMQRLGIRQVSSDNRMQCCEMCRNFESANESCRVFNVTVNKGGWTCPRFDR
jgi:hypothetical protein